MEQSAEQAQEEVIGLGEDGRLVEALLPDRWLEMARELGAFQRAHCIGDARALLQVMLIHLSEGCGLRETAARASVVGTLPRSATWPCSRGCSPAVRGSSG